MKRLTLLLCCFLWVLPARAELISIDAGTTSAERSGLVDEMQKMGIPAEHARARVRALTDDEVIQLSGRLADAQAGGRDLYFAAELLMIIVVIVLLIVVL